MHGDPRCPSYDDTGATILIGALHRGCELTITTTGGSAASQAVTAGASTGVVRLAKDQRTAATTTPSSASSGPVRGWMLTTFLVAVVSSDGVVWAL